MMKWLLDHGADVNRRAPSKAGLRSTLPLPARAENGSSTTGSSNGSATLLLEHGAQLSPLSAATLGRWDYLEKCSKQDLEGKGVLEAAVKGNQPDVLRRLLDLGLDPDERTQIGHIAEQTWSAGGPFFKPWS